MHPAIKEYIKLRLEGHPSPVNSAILAKDGAYWTEMVATLWPKLVKKYPRDDHAQAYKDWDARMEARLIELGLSQEALGYSEETT